MGLASCSAPAVESHPSRPVVLNPEWTGIDGPLPPCRMGSPSDAAEPDTIANIADLPEEGNLGRLVRVRAVLRLRHELDALFDPTPPFRGIPLHIQRLSPPSTIEEVEACKKSVITVEGYLVRYAGRGPARIAIRATAMYP